MRPGITAMKGERLNWGDPDYWSEEVFQPFFGKNAGTVDFDKEWPISRVRGSAVGPQQGRGGSL